MVHQSDPLDQLLADLPRHDASDASVEAILSQALRERDGRAERPEEHAAADRAPRAPRWDRHALVWIAAAASLVLGVGLWSAVRAPDPAPVPAPRSGLTLKGTSAGAADTTLTLGLSLLRDDVPVALVPGASARATDTVLMRYTTDSSGFIYLFRLGPDDRLEVFHGTPTIPGTHHVTVDGRIVGYELNGLRGEHLFGVAYSPDPWAPGTDGDAARPPDVLRDALAGRTGFPRTVDDIVVDARRVRLDPPRQ